MQENVLLEMECKRTKVEKPTLGEQGTAKKLCTILVACFSVDTGM